MSSWQLVSLEDKSRVFQKVAGGPWFLQRIYEIRRRRKIKAQQASSAPREVGSMQSSVSFKVGNASFSRTVGSSSGQYVCRADSYSPAMEAPGEYVMHLQVWQWTEKESEAREISAW